MNTTILTDGRAFVYAQIIGTISIILLGVSSLLAIVISVIWLLAQFVLLAFSSIAMCLSQMGATWLAADPFTRFLMLVSLALIGCWIARRRFSHARI